MMNIIAPFLPIGLRSSSKATTSAIYSAREFHCGGSTGTPFQLLADTAVRELTGETPTNPQEKAGSTDADGSGTHGAQVRSEVSESGRNGSSHCRTSLISALTCGASRVAKATGTGAVFERLGNRPVHDTSDYSPKAGQGQCFHGDETAREKHLRHIASPFHKVYFAFGTEMPLRYTFAPFSSNLMSS